MLLRADLWEAVAQAISAENKKIEIFIHNNHSRGIAREAMLRTIIAEHTRHPFVVGTGFVYTGDPAASPQKQCDVLVYDPRIGKPLYRLDEFVVVSERAATVVVEVKSSINNDELGKIRETRNYCGRIKKPLLAFVYDGWTFDTFCEKFLGCADDMASIPVCTVVHERNYIAICATLSSAPVCFLVDFSQAPSGAPGMATATFLSVYEVLLSVGEAMGKPELLDGSLWQWFTKLSAIPAAARKWVTSDGVLHTVPDEVTHA